MCGIVGYVGPQEPVPLLVAGLRRLEYRGYDSAGVAVVADGRIESVRARGKLEELVRKLDGRPRAGRYGLGHTRWATHGRPSERNAHPILDARRRVAVIHNGIIENFTELKAVVPGLSDRMLSERLKELEAEGIVVRQVTPSTPVRVEYGLTEKGRALAEPIGSISAWANDWLVDQVPAPTRDGATEGRRPRSRAGPSATPNESARKGVRERT